jgi:hypothetical protein
MTTFYSAIMCLARLVAARRFYLFHSGSSLQAASGEEYKIGLGPRFLRRLRSGSKWLIMKVAFLGCVWSAAAATYFEVGFTVTQTNFSGSGPVSSNGHFDTVERIASWNARCVVGLDVWLIESDFIPGRRTIYHYDGTNVYRVRVSREDPAAAAALEKLRANPRVETLKRLMEQQDDSGSSGPIVLTITPGGHPLDDGGANTPWLAFCSGSYLRLPERLLPRSGGHGRDSPGAFGYTDQTSTFEDELGLPARVELFASTALLKAEPTRDTLNRFTAQRARLRHQPTVLMPEGFLTARYEVIAHTNFGGWTIPTHFAYEQFLPGPDGEPWRTVALNGIVTSLRPAARPSAVVSPDKVYTVVDYRFRHQKRLVDSIRYPLTNAIVPPVEDPVLQESFRAAVAAAPVDPFYQGRIGRWIAYALLIFLLTAVPVFWLLAKRVRYQENQENVQSQNS